MVEIGDGFKHCFSTLHQSYTPMLGDTIIHCLLEKIHQLQVQHIVNLLVEPVGTFRYMGLTGLTTHIKT
jgi:hypothetical protein